MDIDIRDTITLSDQHEYVVVSKIDYQGRTYYYLIEKYNQETVKFCFEKEEGASTLIESVDEELNKTLLPLLISKAQECLTVDL